VVGAYHITRRLRCLWAFVSPCGWSPSISGGGECLIGGFRADDFVGRSPQKTGAHATRQGAGSTRAAPGSQEFVLVYKLHPSPRHYTYIRGGETGFAFSTAPESDSRLPSCGVAGSWSMLSWKSRLWFAANSNAYSQTRANFSQLLVRVDFPKSKFSKRKCTRIYL